MSHTNIVTIGIDLGKNTFHVVGFDTTGAIILRKKQSRNQLEQSLANVPACLIGMEACSGAHHLGRKLEKLGHQVRLLPAQYVKPYLKGHKNDFRDAQAIAEATQRPTMRFVPLKSAEQLDLQALHRVRSRLVTQRTAVINQIRGFLLERGLAVRQGAAARRLALPQILSAPKDSLSPRVIQLIQDLSEDWRYLDRRVASMTKEIDELAGQDPHCRRLMSAPGVGPIISSAMVAAIGTGDAFHKGRDFAAWLGLVPKQISTSLSNRPIRATHRGHRRDEAPLLRRAPGFMCPVAMVPGRSAAERVSLPGGRGTRRVGHLASQGSKVDYLHYFNDYVPNSLMTTSLIE
jgi:transposase